MRKRRKIRWIRVFLLLIVLLAMIAISVSFARYAYNSFLNVQTTVVTKPIAVAVAPAPEIPVARFNENINILLLGIDDGDPENKADFVPKRSDAMIVASISAQDGSISLLSIPRDTRVAIPGYGGLEKITHAHFYGGPQLAIKTVEQFLQLPIDYYISIDWQAFVKIIDILGGVDLYVENDMDYEDPYADLQIHLVKGYQHLNGNKAGQYVRFRSDELGDIGRVQRQQRFLKALSNQALQLATIVKLPALAEAVKQEVETDIALIDMLKLVNKLKSFKNESLQIAMLPGQFATIEGLSYWIADPQQTQKLVEIMFIKQEKQVINEIFSIDKKYD